MTRKTKRKFKFKIIFCILFIILFTGYVFMNSEIKENETVNSSRNYIVYNMGALSSDLLMFENDNNRQKDILPMLFEGLVSVDSNNNIVPAIAEKYNYDKNNIKYTFSIREDALWSDGSSIFSSDFKAFLDTALCKSCLKLKTSDFTINCPDDHTLEIKLRCENPDFLYTLCKPEYCIRKLDDKLKNYTNDYKSIVYSGPFFIHNINKDGTITLLKNTNYYDKSNVKSEMLVIESKDSEMALADFEAGKSDIISNPPFCEVQRLLDDKVGTEYNNDTCTFLLFNLDKVKEVDSDAFLNTINKAIDRDNMLNKINGSFLKKASDDLEASKVLSASDIAKLKGKKLKFIYEDDVRNEQCVKFINKAMLSSEGVYCDENAYNENQFKDVLSKKDYDIALCSVSASNTASYLKDKKEVKLYYTPLVVCAGSNINGIFVTKDGNIRFEKACFIKEYHGNSKSS